MVQRSPPVSFTRSANVTVACPNSAKFSTSTALTDVAVGNSVFTASAVLHGWPPVVALTGRVDEAQVMLRRVNNWLLSDRQ